MRNRWDDLQCVMDATDLTMLAVALFVGTMWFMLSIVFAMDGWELYW